MKKSIIIILSIILMLPITVNAETGYLYDVLKNEAESNGQAKEYTREHQDSVNNSGTDKIYHYFAETDEGAMLANEKRNIIFGGFCWQMFRTTDTGGVKILFNGTPTDGKCNGDNSSAINGRFSTYENLSYLSSAGYMYNTQVPFSSIKNPNYGSIIVTGTKLDRSSYNVISNDSPNPFYYSNTYGWVNGSSHTNKAEDISFSIQEAGTYYLEYEFERYYGETMSIYLNDVQVSSTGQKEKTTRILLNDLQPTDVIKVHFNVYADTSRATLKFNVKKPTSQIVDNRAYFGNNVNYENGTYTLLNTIRGDDTVPITNHHFFCADGSNQCSKVYYIVRSGGYNYELSNGIMLDDLVNAQLYDDNVNKYDSTLKSTIDSWYENNLINYQDYLEDTVFCQDRTIHGNSNYFNINAPRESGTDFYKETDGISFEEAYLVNSNLKCNRETDRFSMSNEKAKLKYPVATINLAESMLLSSPTSEYNGSKIRSCIGQDYYLLTPRSYPTVVYGWVVYTSGSLSYRYGSDNASIRPVVSLKKGTKYSSGDGSKNNPYIIAPNHSINVEINNETDDLNIDIKDLSQVVEGEIVNFKVTPIKGRKLTNLIIVDENNNEIEYTTTDNKNYTFTMPASNVTIIPSYERVKNAVNVEDNKNTKELIIEVNDSRAVVYEDTVRFRLQPEEGYEVENIDITDEENNKINYKKTNNINEYEFIMPDTDVTISPKYRKIDSSKLINPNTKRQIILIIISIIVLGIITSIYTVKKKRLN